MSLQENLKSKDYFPLQIVSIYHDNQVTLRSHKNFSIPPLHWTRLPIQPYLGSWSQRFPLIEEISLAPCSEIGCSLMRDRRMETCSVAISNRSLDLADSVIRDETIFCNNWTLSVRSFGALWSLEEGMLIRRQRMGRYLSGIWKQFPVERTLRECLQRIPENSNWWQLQLIIPSWGAQ